MTVMNYDQIFDVIVVGGGHAGTEAALASARMGAKTLLLTHNIETIGQMSCNPAIGGIGKGHLVKEIDALGGVMAQATDHAGIQWRTLNSRKGAAVRATRAQCDRALYRQFIRTTVENQENLYIFQQGVEDLIIENDQVKGAVTQMGVTYLAQTVVLTVGTFLAGKIHIGMSNYSGGRAGDPPATVLAQKLRALPFEVDRLKTGTPPRIDGKTVDFSVMEAQPGDTPRPVFSYMGDRSQHPEQVSCYITHTNLKTHEFIRNGLDRSPMYSGEIEGKGPRYCPSIEDKIMRFADKDSHQIFVEPEGWNTVEIYVNGFSTSLPAEIQMEALKQIPGFEHVKIFRPGYAIEYDFFPPTQLKINLETKLIDNLFFAGQINGTTGYEEAACQGLMAGINAHQTINNLEPFILSRSEAYIGVLIDDLINKGTKEPYRMFTSRAEYRILLRQDNADFRLTEKAHKLGLASDQRLETLQKKTNDVSNLKDYIETTSIPPEEINPVLLSKNTNPVDQKYKFKKLLARPQLHITDFTSVKTVASFLAAQDELVKEQVEILIKYQNYIDKEKEMADKLSKFDHLIIKESFDYHKLPSLSSEAKEKLSRIRPNTIGQASRISGVSPSDISVLLVYFGR